MDKEFIEWLTTFQTVKVFGLKKVADKLWDDTYRELCSLIHNTPKKHMDGFIATEHWLDEYRMLVKIDEYVLTYQEDDVDETFNTTLEDVDQVILKGIIDSFIVFAANIAKKERKLL